jgi:3-oxoacyl-[acyl-carrier-protein] synthase II
VPEVSARERIVVTGVGVVSPVGSQPDFWRRLCAGESGIAPVDDREGAEDAANTRAVPRPDTRAASRLDTRAASRLEARAREWNARDHIRPAVLRRMDRCSQMVVTACRMALADAALELTDAEAEAAGVVVGTAFGNLSESEEFLRGLFAKGPGLVNPLTFPNLVLNAPTGYVAIDLGIRGPNLTAVRGEASGEAALALAYDTLVTGQADVLLAGGGDELAPVLRQIYIDLGLLSPNDGGQEWSSPFDRRRNGFVMGEGAAMLVLETARHAEARGARVLAELAGWVSESLDASPHDWPTDAVAAHAGGTARGLAALGFPGAGTDGGAILAMSCASSMRALDRVEAIRLATILGDARARTLVTSLKGAIGEFGAAGALGAAAAVLALAHGDVPRLGALGAPDAECTLRLADRTVASPRDGFAAAIVSATPRGGGTITLLFRRA